MKALHKVCPGSLLAICLFMQLITMPLTAAEIPTRWFEVEVLLFTRNTPENDIGEEFPQQVEPVRFRRTRDLLTPYHYPDIKRIFNALHLCNNRQLGSERIHLQRISLPELETPQFELPPSTSPRLRITRLTPAVTATPLSARQVPGFEFDLPQWFDLPALPRPDCDYPSSSPWLNPAHWLDPERAPDRSLDHHYKQYPRVIDAEETPGNLYVHLKARKYFRLRSIYRTLRRQPNIRPILHTAWRQPIGAKKRMRATRLYAGIDYSRDYDFQGQGLKPDEVVLQAPDDSDNTFDSASIVDLIEQRIALHAQGREINYQSQSKGKGIEPAKPAVQNEASPAQVREIDGLLKIWVDPFNYLHVDGEFNVRREIVVTAETLVSNKRLNKTLKNYHFKQTRRVISKELHYFDHPYMGMIVQIYHWGW